MGLLRRRHAVPTDACNSEPEHLCTAIGQLQPRSRVRVRGQVMRMRARPATGIPSLAVTLSDETGSLVVVWTGRRAIGGLTLGRKVEVEGVTIRRGNQLEITNPAYTLLP